MASCDGSVIRLTPPRGVFMGGHWVTWANELGQTFYQFVKCGKPPPPNSTPYSPLPSAHE